MVAITFHGSRVIVQNLGEAGAFFHFKFKMACDLLDGHVTILLIFDMSPIFDHAFQSLGLEQLKAVQFLVSADFKPVVPQVFFPLIFKEFENLIVEPYEMITWYHV
jgi:hypothetical protein